MQVQFDQHRPVNVVELVHVADEIGGEQELRGRLHHAVASAQDRGRIREVVDAQIRDHQVNRGIREIERRRVLLEQTHVVEAEVRQLASQALHAGGPRVDGDDRRARTATLRQLQRQIARAGSNVEYRDAGLQRHTREQQQAEGRGPQGELVVKVAELGCVRSTGSRYFMGSRYPYLRVISDNSCRLAGD